MNPESTSRRTTPRHVIIFQQVKGIITSYLLFFLAFLTTLYLFLTLCGERLYIPAGCTFGLLCYIGHTFDKKLIYHNDMAYRKAFRLHLDRCIRVLKHEVKAPVNGVLGLVDLLQDDDSSVDERRELYRLIKKEALHTVGVTDNIHFFDRLLTDAEMIANVSKIDIEKWIADILTVAEIDAKKKKIELMADIASDIGILESDEVRVTEIMINLVGNAIKFSDAGAKVRVKAARLFEQLYIDVQDSGRGISENLMEKIFYHAREYKEIEGSGLGLYTSLGLSNFLGGDIKVKSKKDNGSTFTLILPILYKKPSF